MVGKDYSKIYSWINDWEPVKLQYNVRMESNGVPQVYCQWCNENCKGKWSWWFDEDYGYISFENAFDFVLFKLKRVGGDLKCLVH